MSLVTLLVGVACGTTGRAADATEVRMTEAGCATSSIHVSAADPSEFRVHNEAAMPMVLTLPRQAISVRLEAGASEVVPLNPFLVGTFDYYCMDDQTHERIGGHAGAGVIACPLDPGALVSAGASTGTLSIEQHASP